jgi:hypothetical protein
MPLPQSAAAGLSAAGPRLPRHRAPARWPSGLGCTAVSGAAGLGPALQLRIRACARTAEQTPSSWGHWSQGQKRFSESGWNLDPHTCHGRKFTGPIFAVCFHFCCFACVTAQHPGAACSSAACGPACRRRHASLRPHKHRAAAPSCTSSLYKPTQVRAVGRLCRAMQAGQPGASWQWSPGVPDAQPPLACTSGLY